MKKQILTLGTAMLFAISSTTFIGCGNTENHEHTEGDEHAHSDESEEIHTNTASLEGEKVKDLSLIIDAYFELKTKLADDNEKEAATAAEKVIVAFKEFDKTTLDESKSTEYTEIEGSAIENAEHIVKSEIYHQREHLAILSEDIKDLIALVGTNQKIYIDFCPMAFDSKGAMWLSNTEEISNPYIGSKMPKCGKVKEVIN